MIKELEIVSIKRDLTLQPRTALHQDWVEEYAHDMLGGAAMPPIVVFWDGEVNWLADGFHRVYAAEAASLTTISADVRDGSRRDALLFSVGANAIHGHRRTNEDKRRAVDTLLKDSEWHKWPAIEIARRCAVTHPFVLNRQEAMAASCNDYKIAGPRLVTRNGTTYEMNTGRIGRSAAEHDEQDEQLPSNGATEPRVSEPKFDWDAAHLRSKAMDAIATLAELPPPSDVIQAWMKTWEYGKPIGVLEAAATWLEEFIELYREAEPKRLARMKIAAEKTKEMESAAQQHH